MKGLRLELQPGGAWLLRAGGRIYRVSPATARRIAAGDSPAGLSAALADAAGHGRTVLPRTWIWLRIPLLPAGVVRRLAARLAALTGGWFLAGAALAGLLLSAVQQRWWPVTGSSSPLAALPGVLAAALWHELGHAAALRRAGYHPGRIGAGMLVLLPVLTCDVSAVTLLPRRDRLRVDLAGVAWQALAAGLLSLAGGVLEAPFLALAGGGAWACVAWSLLPLARSDGAWAIRDLWPDGSRPGRIAALVLDTVSLAAVGALLWQWFWGRFGS